MPDKPKIKIHDTRTEGDRVALLVEFDTGEKFWYITHDIEGVEDRLKNKYERTQQMKLKQTREKIEKLKGKKIE